eukprot:TRINITY_DN33317_c0_g1_i1.p1 TRINITY_DN33317_c0_g1~~TRINITY_DN33317_c0_g1_i1.p1  ORF type:complete len:162 (-),score=42.95 TRINITY_DN33317_c0_g1_i1:166-651(-)
MCYSFFFFFKQKTAYEMLRSLVGSEMCIRDRMLGAQISAMPEMMLLRQLIAESVQTIDKWLLEKLAVLLLPDDLELLRRHDLLPPADPSCTEDSSNEEGGSGGGTNATSYCYLPVSVTSKRLMSSVIKSVEAQERTASEDKGSALDAVSYTHLTLPTKRIV